MPLHDEVLEDIIHHGLECCQTVGESEEHDKRFKEATVCVNGSLPLTTILYPYIVEPPLHIQLGEVFHALELGNEFQNDQKRVPIFHCHGIENTIVLDQSQQPILLFDEEHWARHGRF